MLNIIAKNWSILQISLTPPKVFDNKPMITYNQKKKNKKKTEILLSLSEVTLQGGKVFKTHLQILNGESKSCTQFIKHLHVLHK